ncbi:Transcriptional activator NphR [Microbacterium azadirachtae]|uniref:Transcriptional activator NphR n=1 Tax=Microbacterium azadirachtae TaxID=582680 RepID=A0A0F0KTV3_9MICO|nr:helix-turn-helix transcriptional regulator [Microbacterium azadirachtae]KJL24327.1 Transcriptional activator NphR [Microbacterium azadirachtae]
MINGVMLPGSIQNGLGSPWPGDMGLIQIWTPNSSSLHLEGQAFFTGSVHVMTVTTVDGGRFRLRHGPDKQTFFMGLISAGEATLHEPAGDEVFGAGYGMVVMPGDDRSVSYLPGTELVFVECPLQILDDYRVVRPANAMTFSPAGTLADPIRQFAAAVVESTPADPLSGYLVDQLVTEMMIGIVLGVVGIGQLNKPGRADPYTEAMSVISGRYMDPNLTVPSIAALMRVSVRRLQQIFAKKGLSLTRVIRDRRLTEARKLLADADRAFLSLEEVASLAGFGDVQRMRRAFRSAQLPSPYQYRKAAHSASSSTQ